MKTFLFCAFVILNNLAWIFRARLRSLLLTLLQKSDSALEEANKAIKKD